MYSTYMYNLRNIYVHNSIIRFWNCALLKYWASLTLSVLLIGSSVAAGHPSNVLAPDHVLRKYHHL